jgi:hypothetical protein
MYLLPVAMKPRVTRASASGTGITPSSASWMRAAISSPAVSARVRNSASRLGKYR